MAKIGLNNFRYAKLVSDINGTPTYDGPKTPAKAISCNVSITNNDAKLYADDMVRESDTSFQSGTVTIGIDDEDNTTMADLLGHTITEGEIVRNANDIAPYVGFGRVVTKMVGGNYRYKAEVILKAKFSEPSQEDTTKGESIEFGTSELEGQIETLENGDWSRSETFDSKSLAIEYIETIFASSSSEIENPPSETQNP